MEVGWLQTCIFCSNALEPFAHQLFDVIFMTTQWNHQLRRLCVCVCVCVCICLFACACVWTWVRTCAFVCVIACKCVRVSACVCVLLFLWEVEMPLSAGKRFGRC